MHLSKTTLILAATSLVLVSACGAKKQETASNQTRTVRTAAVTRTDLREWLTLSGDVTGELEVDVVRGRGRERQRVRRRIGHHLSRLVREAFQILERLDARQMPIEPFIRRPSGNLLHRDPFVFPLERGSVAHHQSHRSEH